jgi:hypothetical protein
MNTDPTENIRREDQARINAEAAERAELVKQYGMVWSTDELREAFEVLGFMAPYVVVRSKYTGKKGRCSSNNLRGSTSKRRGNTSSSPFRWWWRWAAVTSHAIAARSRP